MKLNRSEAKAAIESFLDTYYAVFDESRRLESLLMCSDAPLFNAIDKSITSHVDLIDKLTDNRCSFYWFVFENDCGNNGFGWKVSGIEFKADGEWLAIKTVDDLLLMMGYGDE